MPTLPRSCSGAARATSSTSSGRQPHGRASWPARRPTRRAWSPVSSSRYSAAMASRSRISSRASSSSRVRSEHHPLERAVVLLELLVEHPRLEQVVDAQHDLDGVERLGDEVARAHLQCALLHRRVAVAGDDQHGQRAARRQQVPQLLEDLEPVELRHVEVEDQQVGLAVAQQRQGLERIGGGVDAAVAAAVQEAGEQGQVLRLVVEDRGCAPRPCRLRDRAADGRGRASAAEPIQTARQGISAGPRRTSVGGQRGGRTTAIATAGRRRRRRVRCRLEIGPERSGRREDLDAATRGRRVRRQALSAGARTWPGDPRATP